MKMLFSPAGIVIVLTLAAIFFFPRRLPDAVKKLGKPMKAFPEDPKSSDSASPDC